MTVQPWPDHLLTLEEWDALPEDTSRQAELVEGVLVVAPRPAPLHNTAGCHLVADLNRQLPATLYATSDVEVVVESTFPATIRAPDVLVISESLFRLSPPRIDAKEVLLAVEIVSPGSRKTDRILKAAEYAGAGIPYYWIIDLADPANLTTFALSGAEYVPTEKATGPVMLTEPATISIDVSRLPERGYAQRPL